MSDTAKNDTATPAPVLVWDRKKAWGSVGLTHYTSATVAGNAYRFVIDKPSASQGWVLRGWVNGSMCMYRDSSDALSLSGMKDVAAAYVAELRRKSAAT